MSPHNSHSARVVIQSAAVEKCEFYAVVVRQKILLLRYATYK